MDLSEFFGAVEDTLIAEFRKSAFVQHSGDKGENREHLLREFLSRHLPKRYGVTKGQVITRSGQKSHSADIIIYDALNCPVLYEAQTAILPIEGVHGIIEVKSSLSKQLLEQDMEKIRSFKELAPRELGVIKTREYVTLHRASRPFGIVLSFGLADNSLDSLAQNLADVHASVHNVNYFTNLVVILGAGLIRYERIDLSVGTKDLLLDTDAFVTLVELAQKRERNGEPTDELFTRVVIERLKERSFGRFYVYLLIMLSQQKLNVPDLAQYLDPAIGNMIVRES